MPLVKSRFRPAWWLPGAHVQTVWSTFFRRRPVLALETERVTLDDGDFIELAWLGKDTGSPLVLLLHGLEGSVDSPYAKGLMQRLNQAGMRFVLCIFAAAVASQTTWTVVITAVIPVIFSRLLNIFIRNINAEFMPWWGFL